MRKGSYSFTKRVLAMLLSVVLVLSLIPTVGVPARADDQPTMGIIKTEVDDPTLDSWKNIFSPTDINTEHVGGIWTDKSVLTQNNLSALGNVPGLTIGKDNFLVALSALAANSVIVGQGSKPTDTVFVLDVSGSMSTTELRSMVAATNNAIHTLLGGSNNQNRVGVVLYSTEASTLLPLDHYTPVVDNGTTEYIELNNSSIRSARVGNGFNVTYLKNSANQNVDRSVRTTGGTYIQGGLWRAWEEFDNATATGGRNPVLVLMTDGAPTFTTNYYNNVSESSNYGTGNSTTDADGFVTQLTAAYVKEKMAQKYNSAAYLYTLGMGIEDVDDAEIAKKIMDPANNTHNEMQTLWSNFEKLATATNKSMTVDLGDSYRDPSISFDATVVGKSEYVDRYFAANQASDLAVAFQNIVNEISLKAGYYVTHLESESANLGGYITFVDEIGSGMQIKEIKGLLLGQKLYSGENFASALVDGRLGTKTEPTSLGDNLVWAVKERLHLTDTDAVYDLLGRAYAAGQLSCTMNGNDVTAYSNYIAWFGDENGQYLGFWDTSDPNAVIPSNAKYVNKCYLMLGSTTADQTNHASDMMYLTIQTSKEIVGGEILAKTPEQVTFRIPAALLPMITYQIKLNGESVDTSTQAEVTYKAATPIRLLYEVGVHEKLNPMNIHEFVREGYQAKDANGNYYLYSNAWRWENSENDWSNPPVKGDPVLKDTGKNSITYAYFEPGKDNEHYYFTVNRQIYVRSGNGYAPLTVAPTSADGEYYYRHYVFNNVGSGITTHYEQLSPDAIRAAITAGTNYVPAGTMHYFDETHSHDVDKNPNRTDSYFAVRHHLVDAKINASTLAEHDYELVYMGNNGRITYAPAQGIVISKEMADGTTPAVDFTFDVVLGNTENVATYSTLLVAVDGTQTEGTVTSSGGKFSVQLQPGEMIYILNIPTNAIYTVTERYTNSYLVSDSVGATGVVTANQVKKALFVNRTRAAGSLSVFKTVEYLNGAKKTAEADNKKFPVTVTFVDGDVLLNAAVKVDGVDVTPTNGQITFKIVDGQTVTITGIPEGYTYRVEEGDISALTGYAYKSGANLTGTIATTLTEAALTNTYTPTAVPFDPVVKVEIQKTLDTIQTPNFTFDFKLQQYNGTAWEDVYVNGALVTTSVTVTEANTPVTANLPLAALSFSETGTYDFRVVEVIPAQQVPGMTYDRTFHDFEVVVTDTNLDGELEISSVTAVGQHTVVTPGADNFNVTAGFTNNYTLGSTKLTMHFKKFLTDIAMSNANHIKLPLYDGQFEFILTEYTDNTYQNAIGSSISEFNGINGDIIFPTVTYTTAGTYYYTVREKQETKSGYTYDNAEFRIAVVVGTNGSDLTVTSVTYEKYVNGTSESNGTVTVTDNVIADDALYFNNTYKLNPATYSIQASKVITNLTLGVYGQNIPMKTDGLFSFTLTAKDGNPIAVEDATQTRGYRYEQSLTLTSKTDGTLSVAPLYFDKAGTYVYTLVENDFNLTGMTKDNSVYEITIVVVDNGAGELIVDSVTYTHNGSPTGHIVFNNTYKADASAPITISGSKVFEVLSGNRNMIDGEFRFVLSRDGAEVESVTNQGNAFAFTELTYNAVGTYVYTVTELHGGQTIDGVKYDNTVYTVTVEVTDNGYDGKLETSVTYAVNTDAKREIVFTNEYSAQPTDLTLTGRKVLAGRPATAPLQAGEFEFNLNGMGINETRVNDASGNVTFSTITYNTPGTYQYTLSEVIPTNKAAGIHYDENVYTVTVTVTDNGKGQLVASVNIPGQDVEDVHFRFFNRYRADASDPVVLSGSKEMKGRVDPLRDNEFSFVLKDAAGNEIETVTNINGIFTFAGLTFDAAGVYKYTISEVNGGKIIGGIKYDASVYDAIITVTDHGTGKLEATVEYQLDGAAAEPKFTNTYALLPTAPVILSGTKNLVGRPDAFPLRDGEFSFTLTRLDIQGKSETVSNIGDTFTFAEMIFTEAGDYHYTVTEVKGGENHNGIDYDKKVYRITIEVKDNGMGQLEAKIIYTDGAVVFTNVYDAADTDEIVLEVDKVLNGRPEQYPLTDDEFSFNIKGEGVDETVTNKGGKVTFSGLTFTQAGIYTYTITEVKGDLDYITYDQTVYTMTVEVTDDGAGKLQTKVTYTKGSTTVEADELVFTNIYDATDTDPLELGGFKELSNITGGDKVAVDPEDGDFSFNLKGNGIDETVKLVDGAFKFSGLTLSHPGVYTYTITEVNGGQFIEGVNYDKAVYTATVTVVDDGSGKLKVASVTYTKDGEKADQIIFSNTYKAEPVTDVVIEATKELVDITGGGELVLTPKDGDFSFVLKQGNEVIATATNVGGKVTFPGMSFDKVGVYNYTISEVAGNATGFSYDRTVYNVTVTVTDNATGQLTAEVKYEKEAIFRNSFRAPNALLALCGKKTLLGGRDLKAGEFSFVLKNSAGEVIQTVTNAANGFFAFDAITYDTVGTYNYTLVEVAGNDDKVTYDPTVYEILVTVTYDGKEMKAVATVSGEAVNEYGFTNIFTPDPAAVTITVEKHLEKKTETNMGLDGFTFQLVNGENVLTAVSGIDGLAKFELTYSAADVGKTYTYKLSEVKGTLNGVTYDDTVYEITVTVTQDSETGALTATVSKKDNAVFTNIYEAAPATDVVIEATKELVDITGGGELVLTPKDGDFSFVLKQGNEVIATATNVGGKVTFPGMSFDKVGVYNYTISEVAGNATGFSYDRTVYNVTVTVTDNATGQLTAEVKYEKEAIFRNSFRAPNALLALCGKKTLLGGRDLKAGEFSFVLKNSAGEVIQTVTNAANGFFAFDAITYDTVGTYNYTLVEVAGNDDKVTYDPTVYEILVTVTYDGKEMKAVATVSGEAVNEYGFTNIFTPDPAAVTITVEKHLEKKTETNMGLDGFTFQLVNGENVLTAVSGIDGLAKFELTYSAADVGKTYTYKLSEVKGTLNGVTYDDTVYEITVTVTQDSETGALTATVSQTENAVFTNIYQIVDDNPQTADQSDVARWTVMLSISAIAMLAVLVIGKEKLFG